MDVQAPAQTSVNLIVEAAIDKLHGGNRFDKLVELRDEAQLLIELEHKAELNRMKEDSERLAKDLAAKKARLAGLDALVAGTAKAKRSDAGKPRAAKAPKAVPTAIAS